MEYDERRSLLSVGMLLPRQIFGQLQSFGRIRAGLQDIFAHGVTSLSVGPALDVKLRNTKTYELVQLGQLFGNGQLAFAGPGARDCSV